MRKIHRTKKFKQDYRRVLAGMDGDKLQSLLQPIVELLTEDRSLPASARDHALVGAKGVRDCHLKPDLILLYERPDDETLVLIRLGSHSELGI
jgi:mRNA interferase YafQ